MRTEDVIVAPVITEKSNSGLQEGKYTFEVNKKATKIEIAEAVEKLFEVKVLKVNTINVYDLLKYNKLVVTLDAVKKLEEVYA